MYKTLVAITLSVVLMSFVLQPGYSQVAKSNAILENGVWHTTVGKQVQITTDVANSQNRDQPFAYIVQIQNQDGVVYSLSWITGTLDAGQSLSPSQSWTPTAPGTYTAQVFVWASVGNPDALSPPVTMQILVS
ncbi:exported hypothetical protein [Nitrosotalea sinensis]|jgi:hypothetical protein|uniref:Intracellular proteinase inhibitor BsuPI domain-containing protein n=1 Tax=Nitrosotalea sinensis TaxID=1499975 RepID=A0A2H1EGJ3_9ARCH|nr:hypothetical protein [Candidatus Nitrosotalea sinensis]SHO45465.1 exported hypothetical protein [Candidatus Nitrosotalea sinensis]